MREIKINVPPWEKYIQITKTITHFLGACKYKRRKEKIEGTDPPTENAEIYAIYTPTKTRKNLNGRFYHMQDDPWSDVTLMPRRFWEKMGKPKLKKSNLQLKQFDRTVIKVMGAFEETFETKKRFEMIPTTAVTCNKDHGQLRVDTLKVNITKLIKSIK